MHQKIGENLQKPIQPSKCKQHHNCIKKLKHLSGIACKSYFYFIQVFYFNITSSAIPSRFIPSDSSSLFTFALFLSTISKIAHYSADKHLFKLELVWNQCGIMYAHKHTHTRVHMHTTYTLTSTYAHTWPKRLFEI